MDSESSLLNTGSKRTGTVKDESVPDSRVDPCRMSVCPFTSFYLCKVISNGLPKST